MTTRPTDACPYARPFPPGFRDCPAYRSARLMPFDSRYRPLKPERTCQHLEVGITSAAGRYYARCAVGTAEDRHHWRDPERERLVAEAEALSEVMEVRMGVQTETLWLLKARQLQAFDSASGGGGAEAATGELERACRRFLVDFEALMEEEMERLDRLNLPLATVVELIREILLRWIPQRSAEQPGIPDELVERFPEQAWWLLRPRTPAR
ncbi:MAG TPA: hypothetical protein VN193_13730 [Candidatus Angelobacter sp.]|jgi:hypothetical protein|nr:hypothetical protein [Candidatus Angelobacter sp.]